MQKNSRIHQPDWDKLTAMINELGVRKGLIRGINDTTKKAERGEATERIRDVSYRKLGLEIGKSPTVLYGIVDRYHRPAADTLAALADYAKRDPCIEHLADRGQWLIAGGVIGEIAETGQQLDRIERNMLALLRSMTEDEKERLYRLALAGKEAIRPRNANEADRGR